MTDENKMTENVTASEAQQDEQNDMEKGSISHPALGHVAKPHKVGPLTLPAYASPLTQTILVGMVCFLVVGKRTHLESLSELLLIVHLGMFNVLASLGGAGQIDPTTADNANIVLYTIFAVFSLVAGSVCNYLGPKITLALGGVGYSLYAASFWCKCTRFKDNSSTDESRLQSYKEYWIRSLCGCSMWFFCSISMVCAEDVES